MMVTNNLHYGKMPPIHSWTHSWFISSYPHQATLICDILISCSILQYFWPNSEKVADFLDLIPKKLQLSRNLYIFVAKN